MLSSILSFICELMHQSLCHILCKGNYQVIMLHTFRQHTDIIIIRHLLVTKTKSVSMYLLVCEMNRDYTWDIIPACRPKNYLLQIFK